MTLPAPPTRKIPPALLLFGTVALLLLTVLGIGNAVSGSGPSGWDREILLALRVPGHPDTPIGPDWLHQGMIALTMLGSSKALLPIVIAAVLILLLRRHVRTALYLAAATGSGTLLVDLLKDLFQRPRPDVVDHLVQVSHFSFPSGHSANSAIVFLSLGTLLARVERWPLERAATLALAMALAVSIGFSRLYLGVHWPSDVAAGWMLGAAWAMLWWTLAARHGRAGRSA